MASRAVPMGSAPQSSFQFVLQELKPKGKLLTPFNIISVPRDSGRSPTSTSTSRGESGRGSTS